jgi:hypothetical protein
LRLIWPSHHDCSPTTVYTVRALDVWKLNERPGEVYDSYRKRVHETCNVEPSEIQYHDPNDLLNNVLTAEIVLPATYKGKFTSPYKRMIDDAENREWETLNKNKTFSEPIPLSSLTETERKSILRGNWLYKAKPNKDGTLKIVKARFVADGSKEKTSLDWWQVYSPVAMIPTLRILIVTTIQYPDARLWEGDVQNAYTTADIVRDVLIYYPDGKHPNSPTRSCLRLLKALYGVADSGKAFYDEWIAFHISIGFRATYYDRCYLEFYISEKEWIRFVFHVDDSIYGQLGLRIWQWYLQKLSEKYTSTIVPLSYCLGIEFDIDYDQGIVKMTQAAQIDKMLRDLGHTDLKPVHGPNSDDQPTQIIAPHELTRNDVINFPMQKYIGHINYLQVSTRPDISRDLKILSKFPTKFGLPHIRWAKRIVRYLASTRTVGLTYRRVPHLIRSLIQVFTDASHASDPDTRRSITGIVIKLAGNTILWKNLFQRIVSHSSTESELMALDLGATLGQYIKWLCEIFRLSSNTPLPVYVDNQATIILSSNPVQPGRNLHIHARYFYVRDLVTRKELIIVKIHTDDQLADILVSFKSFETYHRLRTLLMNCAYVNTVDDKLAWITTYIM